MLFRPSFHPPPIFVPCNRNSRRIESRIEVVSDLNVHWETEGHLQLATWGTTTVEKLLAAARCLIHLLQGLDKASLTSQKSQLSENYLLQHGGTHTKAWPFCRRFFETGDEFKGSCCRACRRVGRITVVRFAAQERKTLIFRLAHGQATTKSRQPRCGSHPHIIECAKKK